MSKGNGERRFRIQGCGCRCGCLSILLEILAFVILCNILGCEWARKTTHDMIDYIKEETR